MRAARSRLRTARGRDTAQGAERDLLLPRPAEARCGSWEGYISPAPGPELPAPIPVLSTRVQSSCHHAEPVLRKLKFAMLYGPRGQRHAGKSCPGRICKGADFRGSTILCTCGFHPSPFLGIFWRLPVTATFFTSRPTS